MVKLTEKRIPAQCDVLVIGGGPAGSSVAIELARSGVDVVLLERATFPRNQVGESLIPHFWKFADNLGLSEKIQRQGFVAKAGGITLWNGKIRQISFAKFGYQRPGLHVERDIFDDLLLMHAQDCGAQVFCRVMVKKVNFKNNDHPVVSFFDKRQDENEQGSVRCQYVIDASGHNTFLANSFKTRQLINPELNYLSLWGYFKDSRYVGVDRKSHDASELSSAKPVTFVTSYRSGWLWHIILRGKTSVGLIIPVEQFKSVGPEQRERYFLQACEEIPSVAKLLENARFIEGSLQFRPNYSYFCEKICGDNYYCIGDAAAFADPIFSHGVQNAFYNAAVACLAIKASLKRKRSVSYLGKIIFKTSGLCILPSNTTKTG